MESKEERKRKEEKGRKGKKERIKGGACPTYIILLLLQNPGV